ncbi:MAG: DUF1707 domain-containing protein [Rectinemataceae bacterium]
MNDRYRGAPDTGSVDFLESGRQKALDRLTSAFALGDIDVDEYEKRASLVQRARGQTDLEACVADLPESPMPRAAPKTGVPKKMREPRYEETALRVEDRGGPTETVACIMGDRRMTGDWLGGNSVTSFTLMGETVLDLRHTALPSGRLKIDAFSLMGEIKVIVPHGLPVKMSAFPFMGEARMAEDVERRIDRGAPWVEISGFAMMASIVVKAQD